MSLRVRVIDNARAGPARRRRRLSRMWRTLQENGCRLEHLLPASPEETMGLIASATRDVCDLLAISGGDGTLHLAVQSLLQLSPESRPPLAVIPAGRGTDFAHEIGVHTLASATRAILSGRERSVDVGRCGAGYFLGIAGTGFDSVAARRAQSTPLLSGRTLYTYAALRTLAVYEPINVRLVGDGNELYSGPITLVAAGNTRRYGGGMFIAPEARHDDGRLDVCVAEAMPMSSLLRLFPQLFRERAVVHDAVSYFRVEQLEIETQAPKTAELFADGEFMEELPSTISVMERELVVRVP